MGEILRLVEAAVTMGLADELLAWLRSRTNSAVPSGAPTVEPDIVVEQDGWEYQLKPDGSPRERCGHRDSWCRMCDEPKWACCC